eukprot:208169-Pyramimonas_sp.AAC.1
MSRMRFGFGCTIGNCGLGRGKIYSQVYWKSIWRTCRTARTSRSLSEMLRMSCTGAATRRKEKDVEEGDPGEDEDEESGGRGERAKSRG